MSLSTQIDLHAMTQDEYCEATYCVNCAVKKHEQCKEKGIKILSHNCAMRKKCRFDTVTGIILTFLGLLGIVALLGVQIPGF